MFNVGQAYKHSRSVIDAGRELNLVSGKLKAVEQNLHEVYAGEDASILDSFIQQLEAEVKDIGREASRIGELIEREAAALQRELEEAERRRNQLKKSQSMQRSR